MEHHTTPPLVRIFPDSESASATLARETTEEVRAAGSGGWTVGLPTGNTPLALYRGWISLHRLGQLSFASVRSFNLDEYWPAPPGAAFADYMEEHLFAHVDLPLSHRHLLDGRVPASTVDQECARFERALRSAGGLDLQLLGLGHNGHIGFNEPGSPADSRTRRVRLSADTRARAAAARPEWGACAEALTMGVGTILEARRIVVLAFGAAKAEPVRRALEGAVSPEFPASFLRAHPRVSWVLDAAAAARIRPAPGVE